MSCPFTADDLSAWAQGEEERAAVAAEIASHVSQCPPCAALVREMQTLYDDLREIAVVPSAAAAPQRIGRYTIRGRVGQGGMGIVYDAEQDEPRRRVALKVIRGSHVDDPLQQALFAREAQILARLNHPHIAAIYEAGRTEHGEPYFAMEFVDGTDLMTFAQRPRVIGLRERVSLFLRIAQAMVHAHERGIVHRDLKPGNILVSGGAPKILDFGLARAIEAATDARTTQPGMLIGTLAYMSPEQARGDADSLDLRTDVYSLGVILYELLTGRLPIDVSRDPVPRALARIENETPIDPRRHNAHIPADVSLIALKCLANLPAERYESAAALAADVDAYLTGLPIRARPPSRLYRAKRFLARNALASALTGLFFAALAIGGGFAAVQARRLAIERDNVREQARRVERLNGVLESLWQSVDPWKAGDREARVLDVLREISRRIDTEMADTPLLAAAVHNTLGATWRTVGSLEDFNESERHLRAALKTRSALLGERHAETAQCAHELAETLYWKGEFDEAERLAGAALETRRKLLPPDHPDIADTLNNLGGMRKQLNRLDEAARDYEEALSIRNSAYQRELANEPAVKRDQTRAAEELAETRNNRGALRRAQSGKSREAGKVAEADAALRAAEGDYRAALELRTVWLGDAHPATATSHNNLARALQDAGRFADAEKHLREALRILRGGVGERHQLVARALHNLGRLKREMGELDAAREFAEQAHAMRSDLFGPAHRETAETAELLASIPLSNK